MLIAILVFQNRKPVETYLLFKTVVMSHATVLFFTAWFGFVLGILVGLLAARKSGRRK